MHCRYNTTCSLANLKGIRDFVKKSLQQQVPDALLGIIVLAMDEACSNIMIHAHRCDPEHSLEIHITRPDSATLVFEIVDEGNTFDINGFREPRTSQLVHERRKGGLGVRLIKSVMDKIEHDMRDGKTICRLTKKTSNTEIIY